MVGASTKSRLNEHYPDYWKSIIVETCKKLLTRLRAGIEPASSIAALFSLSWRVSPVLTGLISALTIVSPLLGWLMLRQSEVLVDVVAGTRDNSAVAVGLWFFAFVIATTLVEFAAQIIGELLGQKTSFFCRGYSPSSRCTRGW
ncbi:hypothetical protein CCHOA_09690 [Corynebacterium choanae]|uniref:Uncharacterized protein n=2 Tax=Corynebacterium choanae TaxID=1862358 RepID=A0A3G6J884_9CORY|nr:hypothetical protein CCHOA_09690 [Corynebacterium choanae]